MREKGLNMFEVGHSVIRVYPKIDEENYIVEGEITSISENADGETDVTVMYNDGGCESLRVLGDGRKSSNHCA